MASADGEQIAEKGAEIQDEGEKKAKAKTANFFV